jgi:cell division protein FtsQ
VNARALANRERALQAERFGRFGRSILLLAATLLLFGTVILLAADQLYRPDTFVIDQLKIKGKFRYLDPVAVERVVKSKTLGNFFTIDLQDIKNRCEQLPWVQRADVRREWPNTLLILLEEQQPVMRWGKDQWVNAYGEVVKLPTNINFDPRISLLGNPKDAKLMMRRALEWEGRLKNTGLQITGLALSDSHAYRLQLQQLPDSPPFELLLGRREVEERLDRFLMLYETQLRADGVTLQRVDARYPDGLAIKSIEPTQNPESEPIALNQINALRGQQQ